MMPLFVEAEMAKRDTAKADLSEVVSYYVGLLANYNPWVKFGPYERL